jgi:hypothetical protein
MTSDYSPTQATKVHVLHQFSRSPTGHKRMFRGIVENYTRVRNYSAVSYLISTAYQVTKFLIFQ